MLFRSVRRRTVWKEAAEEIVAVEFQDRESGEVDLNPSVYVVEATDNVRIAAEHTATASLLLTKKRLPYVDLVDTLGGFEADSPTDPIHFELASTAHRELMFASIQALRTFLEARIQRWTVDQTPKWSLVDYVVDRRREDDREWLAFFTTGRGQQWSTKCDEREEAG